jgi:integrase
LVRIGQGGAEFPDKLISGRENGPTGAFGVRFGSISLKKSGSDAAVDLEPRAYGRHSLRRAKVALLYKKTGNIRACQLLLGHRKLESTVRYLGIEVDDALSMSEQIDL